MATPVQEDQTNIQNFNQSAEEYLQEHQVFDIFSQLCQKLVINKPRNALEFMISELENDIRKCYFTITSPLF